MRTFNIIKSFLVLVCCFAIILSSAFAVTAEPTTSTDVSWYSLENLVSAEKKEKEMIFYITVNGNNEKLTLSFPSSGGVRLNSQNKGFFKKEQYKRFFR